MIQIYSGIHTGGKTYSINKFINDPINEKYDILRVDESDEFHKFISTSDNKIFEDELDYFTSHRLCPESLKSLIKDVGVDQISTLHKIAIFIWSNFYHKIDKNENKKYDYILLDRIPFDATYYNKITECEVLDKHIAFYNTLYILQVSTFLKTSQLKLKLYIFYNLTYDEHLKRLDKRGRKIGDINLSKDEFKDLNKRIEYLYKSIEKLLRSLSNNVETIHS